MVHPQGGERSPAESQRISSCACDIQNICDLEKRINHEVTHLMVEVIQDRINKNKLWRISDGSLIQIEWRWNVAGKNCSKGSVYMGEAQIHLILVYLNSLLWIASNFSGLRLRVLIALWKQFH